MSNVVMLLESEHRRLSKLLDLVEQQATNFRQREAVNYALLVGTFEYLSSYPDRCHHPKEDLVYRKLLRHSPELAASLKNLVEEHEQLSQATADVMRAVQESQRAPVPSDEHLAARLTQFVELYRHHMLMEDRYFFPVALGRLSQDDFDEIDFSLFDRPDPLLDREAEVKFAALHDEIMRLGVAESANIDSRKEAALLASMQDVAAFNDVMHQFGETVSLIGSPREGYELRGKGSMLVHIPECSESRAAWCAYFFWKASARRSSAP